MVTLARNGVRSIGAVMDRAAGSFWATAAILTPMNPAGVIPVVGERANASHRARRRRQTTLLHARRFNVEGSFFFRLRDLITFAAPPFRPSRASLSAKADAIFISHSSRKKSPDFLSPILPTSYKPSRPLKTASHVLAHSQPPLFSNQESAPCVRLPNFSEH